MVASEPLFTIDATFILDKTAKAFLGAQLLTVNGRDQTFCFGFFRELLRLRAAVAMERGILVVGREGHDVASEGEVASIVAFAQEMDLSVVDEAERSVLDICHDLSTIATHLITDDLKLLQLSSDRLLILLPKGSNGWERLCPEAISAKTGVRPQEIPTLVALHDAKKGHRTASPLTKRQAIRLIELYGDIDGIYANLESIRGSAIRETLVTSRVDTQKKYHQALKDHRPVGVDLDPQSFGWEIDNDRIVELLHTHRFHSLVRLLPLEKDSVVPEALDSREKKEYVVVQDKDGLRRLESLLRAADMCALDCESDNKDPRKATLLGVALAFRKGEAFFLPVMESDLKGISKKDVINVLSKALSEQLRVVGHNIKYDALLLRRHDIKINNIYFDTMLAAYDCYGDWDFLNLAYLSERLLGKRIKTYGDIVKNHETFLDLPLHEMTNHGCQDADITLQLHPVLDKELKTRRLRTQYDSTTLTVTRTLIECEFQGLPVYLEKLEEVRSALVGNIGAKREQVAEKLGRKIDLDSTKDLKTVLKELLHLGAEFTLKSLSQRRLEELAISYPDVRRIVEYKRLRRQLKLIESIAFSAKEGKIYPLFNQVRSPVGLLASTDPNLFEDVGDGLLKNCIDPGFNEFFPDRRTAVGCLQEASGDANFLLDWEIRKNSNRFMAQHPIMKALDHDELLLAIASGMSGPALSRKFMLDRITIDSMIYDLKTRYGRLFSWLAEFREEALKKGYVTGPKGIKYLDGLKSASIEKRKNSAVAAVRWFISY